MTDKPPACSARVPEMWGPRPCGARHVAQIRANRRLCTQHAKIYDRWVEQRRAESMTAFWWDWREARA